MLEIDATAILILLAGCAIMLLIALLLIFRISMRLTKIERLVSGANGPLPDLGSTAPSGELTPTGAFETFLGEDQERRRLTKGEQQTAYRKWRQEKGLNWSNS